MASLSLDDSQPPLSEQQQPQHSMQPQPPPPPRAMSARPKRKAEQRAAEAANAAAAAALDSSSALGHVSSPTADDDDDDEDGRIADEPGADLADPAALQRSLQHVQQHSRVEDGGEAKKPRRSPQNGAADNGAGAAAAYASPHAAAAAASPAARPVLSVHALPAAAPQSPARLVDGSGSQSQDVRSHKSPQQLRDGGAGGGKRGRARARHSVSSSSDQSDSGGGGGGSGGSSRSSSTSGSGSDDDSSSSDTGDDEPLNSQEQAERAHMLATEQPQDNAAAAAAVEGGLGFGSDSVADSAPLFRCTSTHIDSILQMLNAIRIEKKKDQVCRLTLGSLGMKVSCELAGSRAMCAKAYLKKDLFSDYRLNTHMIRAAAAAQGAQAAAAASVDYTCHLSLNCLIDSLMILGSGQKDTLKDLQSCVLHLEIQAHNHPLIVILDGDAGGYHNVTTAEIQMREQEGLDSNDGFHIGKDKLLLAVVNGTPFRHAFSELDMSDVDLLTMTAKIDEHNKSSFAMSVAGHGGMQTEVELSHEAGSNVFYGDKIELPNKGFRLSYDIKHLRPCIRALHKAQMSNFRIGIDGLLSIQHIIPIASAEGISSQWVEFFITAKELPETEDLMPQPLPPQPMDVYNGADDRVEAEVAAAAAAVAAEYTIVRDDDEEKHPDADMSMRSPDIMQMEQKRREQQQAHAMD